MTPPLSDDYISVFSIRLVLISTLAQRFSQEAVTVEIGVS